MELRPNDVICSGYDEGGNPQNLFLVTGVHPIRGLPLYTNIMIPIPWGYPEWFKTTSIDI